MPATNSCLLGHKAIKTAVTMTINTTVSTAVSTGHLDSRLGQDCRQPSTGDGRHDCHLFLTAVSTATYFRRPSRWPSGQPSWQPALRGTRATAWLPKRKTCKDGRLNNWVADRTGSKTHNNLSQDTGTLCPCDTLYLMTRGLFFGKGGASWRPGGRTDGRATGRASGRR